MPDNQFKAFLSLLVCSDPWPTPQPEEDILKALADDMSVGRGYEDWIDAYHKMVKPNPPRSPTLARVT